MQHNPPAENENIFSDERVLLRPMDYGQFLVCRKPTDPAKVIGWFIACLAACAILISLVSLATGIRPIFVAEQGSGGKSLRPRSVEHAAKELSSYPGRIVTSVAAMTVVASLLAGAATDRTNRDCTGPGHH